MGKAFLALYRETDDPSWLLAAEQAAGFIANNFAAISAAGFASATQPTDPQYGPRPDAKENADLTRFASQLFRITKDDADAKIARRAVTYLVTKEAASGAQPATLLQAVSEFNECCALGND